MLPALPVACRFTLTRIAESMKYGLKLDNPKEFYHELHRPVHFINFTSQVIYFCVLPFMRELTGVMQDGGAEQLESTDREDLFA